MKHKENILKLRAEGKSYNEICEELGCSKGTVAYHLGEGQREKSNQRNSNYRKKNPLQNRIYGFKHNNKPKNVIRKKDNKRGKQRALNTATRDFQRRDGSKLLSSAPYSFNEKDVLKKFGENPTCYLTGKQLDWNDTFNWNFDHVIPATRGGDNSFENLQVASRVANNSKNDLTLEEFLLLCKEVLEHHGYEVNKIN